jgi:energy-coupling factor transporter ATP-binding protein EcfA2
VLREIVVENYQSLRKLTVRLGWFTVVTGATGSGKSGLFRSVRLLAFNDKGTSYITNGEKTCMVSASGDEIERTGMDDDRWVATIHRGGKNDYQLGVGVHQKTYTKLAGKVPEAVSQVMQLGEVNFASQFDRPYLLDSTGSEVARVLGRLTNVTLLYRAAQEANRRRLRSSGELTIRMTDLADLQEQAAQYATLPAEREAVEAAEASMARIAELEQRRDRLQQWLAFREQTERSVQQVRVVGEPPSLELLEEFVARRDRLEFLLGAQAQRERVSQMAILAEKAEAEQAAEVARQLDEYSAQWGVCPECGQPVLKEHGHQ